MKTLSPVLLSLHRGIRLIAITALLCLIAILPCSAQVTPDDYDVLLPKCDGTGTNFTDSSITNPKTITANGNATQLPCKFNRTAGFFSGTTDYLVGFRPFTLGITSALFEWQTRFEYLSTEHKSGRIET